MALNLEARLDDLMSEIRDIKKELILERVTHRVEAKKRVSAWKTLGEKISARWDRVPAVDEIAQQREKTW